MWQGIQKLKCFENNSVFWSTGVFRKHFSSLMHCHTWCKQASNLHEDKEWITQPFFLHWLKKMWGEWMVTSRWVDQKHFNVKRTTTHWKLANILQQFWNGFLLQSSAKMVSHQSFTAQILFHSVLEKWLGYSCFVLM